MKLEGSSYLHLLDMITNGPIPTDKIETLVDQAHQIFNQISTCEVIDMDRETATVTLQEFYEHADGRDIDRYLDVVELLRIETGT